MLPLSNQPTVPFTLLVGLSSFLLMLHSFRVELNICSLLQNPTAEVPIPITNESLPDHLSRVSFFSLTILPHLKVVDGAPLETTALEVVTAITCFPMPTGSSPDPSGRHTNLMKPHTHFSISFFLPHVSGIPVSLTVLPRCHAFCYFLLCLECTLHFT